MLKDVSTGASNDIERASSIARKMVTRYGMSEKLGPIVYGTSNEEVFLGRDFGSTKNYSEKVSADIDAEVRNFIELGYARAKEILKEHMEKLHKVAGYLYVNEKMDGEQFEEMFREPEALPPSGEAVPES